MIDAHELPVALLAVRDLHAVVRAGYGNATAAVRVLDGVSLDVHVGELLLVRGPLAGGAQALRSALAGVHASSGERRVRPGVLVRRGSIPRGALDAIVTAWRDDTPPALAPTSHGAARVVYLLRVRDDEGHASNASMRATFSASSARAWRDWAAAVRGGNGAAVLFSAERMPAAEHMHAVREARTVIPYGPGGVRELVLAAGRIVSERVLGATASRVAPVSPSGGSDGSPWPTAASRCSRGSTAPSSRDADA